MVSVCLLLFVCYVACDRSLYAIETSLTGSLYDFSSYKPISLPNGREVKRLLQFETAYGDTEGYKLHPDTTHVAFVYGDDERFITLSDKNSLLPQFVGNLIVQVCETNSDCFAKEIGKRVGGLSSYSIKIGGRGLSGQTYLETTSYKVDMGYIKDDGRYTIFNFPAFIPVEATVHPAGITIDLAKATRSTPTVVKEEDIDTMGYLGPRATGVEGDISLEVIIPEDFGNSSLVIFSACFKTGADTHCDKLHIVWRLTEPPKQDVLHWASKFTADTYAEVSFFKFENNFGSVRMRWIYFGVAVIKNALFEKYEELPCGNEKELRCSIVRCTSDNEGCYNFKRKRSIRVSVKGNSLNKRLIKINGKKIGYFQCKNIGNRQSCTGEVILPVLRKNVVQYGQCTASLGTRKSMSYEMCGGGSKLITFVMESLP